VSLFSLLSHGLLTLEFDSSLPFLRTSAIAACWHLWYCCHPDPHLQDYFHFRCSSFLLVAVERLCALPYRTAAGRPMLASFHRDTRLVPLRRGTISHQHGHLLSSEIYQTIWQRHRLSFLGSKIYGVAYVVALCAIRLSWCMQNTIIREGSTNFGLRRCGEIALCWYQRGVVTIQSVLPACGTLPGFQAWYREDLSIHQHSRRYRW